MVTPDPTSVLVALPGTVAALACAGALGYLTSVHRAGRETILWFFGFIGIAIGTALLSPVWPMNGASGLGVFVLILGDVTRVLGFGLLVMGLALHLGHRVPMKILCLLGSLLLPLSFIPHILGYSGPGVGMALQALGIIITFYGLIFCLVQRRRLGNIGLRFVALAFGIAMIDAVLWHWRGASITLMVVEASLAVMAIVCLAMGFGLVALRSQQILTEETDGKLQFTEERYRLALQGASDGVWDWDLQADTVLLTPRVAEIAGVPFTKELFHPKEIENFVHPEDLPAYKAALNDVFKGISNTLTVEYRLRCKRDAQACWALSRGVAVRDPVSGRVTRMAGTLTDTTERKLFERELIEAKEEAELASRSKTEFLAHMSHELRTPLNAIIGFSDMMKQEVFGPVGNERYVDYNATVNMAGRHLMQIISDIIDLGKIEAGQTRLDDTLCDLEEIAEACIQLVAARARDEKLGLTKKVDPSIPWVRGDAIRIKQIVLNLLTNSIKFTKSGGEVVLAIDKVEGSKLQIQVRDTGVGIARKDIPRALSRFGRLGSPYTRDKDGMGLGLTLVQTFARLHGASFDLDSEEGVGTTVTVVFPANRSVEREGTEASTPSHPASESGAKEAYAAR